MKSYKNLSIVLVVLSLCAGLAAHTSFAQIATPSVTTVANRSADIPFELYRNNRIFVSGTINGVETPMVLDSGAGVTMIDRGFARSIGLKEGRKVTAHGTGGKQTAELVQGVTFAVGNLNFSGVTVGVIDLAAIEKAIGRPIPVILGRELFMNSIVSVDFDRKLISLRENDGFVPPTDASMVQLKRDGTLHYLPVSVAGLPPVDAAFDLGNGGAISLSKEYHEANPRLGALPYAVGMGGGVGGLHEMRRTTLPTVEIAGFSLSNVPADLGSVKNSPYKGRANAGIQMFVPFQLTLDLAHDRLWLQRTEKPPVFPKDRTGLFMVLEDNQFNILHVSPGSPADKAGLKKGDHLIAIGDQKVGPKFYTSAMGDWARGAVGTNVTLTKANGQTVALTLSDYY